MAHGTGYYWNRIYDADLEKDEYVVIVHRLYYYYYPQMSDCYEPDCESKDEFEVIVIKWKKEFRREYDRKTGKYKIIGLRRQYADHTCESSRTGSIDIATARVIWWNLKHKNISFVDCKNYFAKLAGRELTA